MKNEFFAIYVKNISECVLVTTEDKKTGKVFLKLMTPLDHIKLLAKKIKTIAKKTNVEPK